MASGPIMHSPLGIKHVMHDHTIWFMETSLPFTIGYNSHANNDQWGASYGLDTSRNFTFPLMC